MTGPAVESLASDPFVVDRSDWGIDTVMTHATAVLELDIYEHNVPEGKRHALYGSLTDIHDMILECLDAVASLRGRPTPGRDSRFDADPPAAIPDDLKVTTAYDIDATRRSIARPLRSRESVLMQSLGVDPEPPIVLDADRWLEILPRLLDRFVLDDADWQEVAFRLWVGRVISYTTTQVPRGYDHAMSFLEETITRFEKQAS